MQFCSLVVFFCCCLLFNTGYPRVCLCVWIWMWNVRIERIKAANSHLLFCIIREMVKIARKKIINDLAWEWKLSNICYFVQIVTKLSTKCPGEPREYVYSSGYLLLVCSIYNSRNVETILTKKKKDLSTLYFYFFVI